MPASRKRKNPKREDDSVVRTLVNRLYDDVAQESTVVFVGAGSTTERRIHGPGFYRLIAHKASYPSTVPEPSFPKLMQYFCDELDGGQHNRLIREAIAYLEEFFLPGEQHAFATSVSRSLLEIPYLNRFVTTNWDPFIERSLDVLVPIIEDRDLAFWNDQKKQVLKIHGCITRPYSIVATETDYRECIGRNPLIFNKLKDLMATKTFIFMGYSMRDEDFQEIWQTITQALGKFTKLAYAIDPNATEENVEFWRSRGIQIFKTSDVAFLRYLRERLENEDLVPSRKFLEFLQRQRKKLVSIHVRLKQDSDGGMASSMYQDGLLHALGDILSATILGMKRNREFESELAEAAKAIRRMKAKRDPVEIAYWSGHHEVLRRFCSRDKSPIPAYFHPYNVMPIPRFVQGRKW